VVRAIGTPDSVAGDDPGVPTLVLIRPFGLPFVWVSLGRGSYTSDTPIGWLGRERQLSAFRLGQAAWRLAHRALRQLLGRNKNVDLRFHRVIIRFIIKERQSRFRTGPEWIE
jgi:hypothetical protein